VETFLETGGVTPINWTSYDFSDIRYVAGYGAGYLFFSYLMENYGGRDFIWNSMRICSRGVQTVEESIRAATGQSVDLKTSSGLDALVLHRRLPAGLRFQGFAVVTTTRSPGQPARAGLDRIIGKSRGRIRGGNGSYQGQYYRIEPGSPEA
jgi:hypothetical protein